MRINTSAKNECLVRKDFVILAFSFLVFMSFVMFPCQNVFGQEKTGTIEGTVKDSSGAVLPGAMIMATNKTTNRITTVTSTNEGIYVLRTLEPGRYTVTGELKGFSKYELPDVLLLLGKTLKIDMTLQVGTLEQAVQISEAAPVIDTQSIAMGSNVSSEEFSLMPKGRSFQDVASLSPGVNSGVIEGGIQVNGASGAENNYTIDGISTSGLINGDSRQNAVYEFLQEVQVKTSGIQAEYGGALGGVISAVTKSGGNAFHGDLYWYLSGSPLNALPTPRLLTDPASELATSYFQDNKIQDHINEVGGELGGYIVKNKLYFYTGFSPQWSRRTQNILLDSGATPSIFYSNTNYYNLFNKLSWNITPRILTNFAWLYTTTKRSGLLPNFTGYCNNCSLSSENALVSNRTQGWYLPKNNFTGTMDITLSPTSLLNLRGGYFWDNYKDFGVSTQHQTRYNISAIGLPFAIPTELQHPSGYFDVPLTEVSNYDVTSRAFGQADYSKTFNMAGVHNLKAGFGYQRLVNKMDVNYQGGFNVAMYWNRSYKSSYTGEVGTGTYGYYRVRQIGTSGSAGGGIYNLFIQDQWTIRPRLTLNLGLRTENELIPSFYRQVKDYAFSFGFGSKLAPRLGLSWDVLGNGKMKLYGSWGRFYDWTKYELVRGSFGGDTWKEWWYSLDTLDIFSLGLNNLQGRNLWSSTPGSYQDHRVPQFGPDALDPGIQPMYVDNASVGFEWEVRPQLVVSAAYVRSRLGRTIEDIGRLVNGNETYTEGNPGSGRFAIETNHYGATPDFAMPVPKRQYDAMELSITRRFSNNWFLSANYTYSRLWGNYAGLSSTDEIVNGGLPNITWTASQTPATWVARPGGNANRDYDADLIMFDSNGQFLYGRLETDRPHVLKVYGSYQFKWGTQLGPVFYAGSGTPITTRVEELNQIPLMVNGRADAGRMPFLNYTNLLIAQDIKLPKLGETKRLHFEMNIINIFNQKTALYQQNIVTRYRDSSSAMDMTPVNLLNGYNWHTLLSQTPYAQDPSLSSDPNSLDPTKNWAVDPTYGKFDQYNTGFNARFGIKFIF